MPTLGLTQKTTSSAVFTIEELSGFTDLQAARAIARRFMIWVLSIDSSQAESVPTQLFNSKAVKTAKA